MSLTPSFPAPQLSHNVFNKVLPICLWDVTWPCHMKSLTKSFIPSACRMSHDHITSCPWQSPSYHLPVDVTWPHHLMSLTKSFLPSACRMSRDHTTSCPWQSPSYHLPVGCHITTSPRVLDKVLPICLYDVTWPHHLMPLTKSFFSSACRMSHDNITSCPWQSPSHLPVQGRMPHDHTSSWLWQSPSHLHDLLEVWLSEHIYKLLKTKMSGQLSPFSSSICRWKMPWQ